tara:strand:+ start:612 stop:1478 length:867 start_codon:yes stop_codon:yes gene_type:complete
METKMSDCYSYEIINFEQSSLNVNAVYVLTMENSDRLEELKKQLYIYKPGKRIIIQINRGYKKCAKRLCNNSKEYINNPYNDLSHAYLNVFKNAIQNKYQNILILEDDAIFSPEYYNASNLKIVNEFIPKLNSNQWVFALGLVPWVSLYYSYGIRRSILASGTHATIFPISIINNIVQNCNSITDMDVYVNTRCVRYFYDYPLVTQTYPETENSKYWCKDFGFFGSAMRNTAIGINRLFGLDKQSEPGTTILYNINKILCDMLIPLFIIYILFLIVKKVILLNIYKYG